MSDATSLQERLHFPKANTEKRVFVHYMGEWPKIVKFLFFERVKIVFFLALFVTSNSVSIVFVSKIYLGSKVIGTNSIGTNILLW